MSRETNIKWKNWKKLSKRKNKEKINQRVQQALEHIDKRKLILAPDCGLGFLPRKLCLQKLKIITKVAKSFINQYN